MSLPITENFSAPQLHPNLQWLNPPQQWRLDSSNSRLIVESDAKTDFWRTTHYGFIAESGHFLYAEVPGDFILSTHVRFHPVHQYDQAGLMVRLSPECWLKASVEFELHGPCRLGAVVTNQYSDWSTQDVSADLRELSLRIRREGPDYIVEYTLSPEESPAWSQIRMARLVEDDGIRPVQCGLYACSPTAAGYSAEFCYLKILPGRI